jgi:hypothetical protein
MWVMICFGSSAVVKEPSRDSGDLVGDQNPLAQCLGKVGKVGKVLDSLGY